MRMQLMQKTGQIERTVDREYAEEEAKYKAYVCTSTKPPTRLRHLGSGSRRSALRYKRTARHTSTR
jgi:hypothetical protein